jgi:hypothetical protein
MNSDDDTFFEDEDTDENETYADEDIVDEDYEEDEEEEIELEEVRSYGDEGISGLAKFLADPWPPTVFLITIVGLGIVLLTPDAIWAPHRYSIIGIFFLFVMSLVGIAFSLITWNRAGTHRLRWAGPVNIIVILAAGGVGTADTVSWILNGTGIVAGLDQSLMLLCIMLVFFSIYMLWMIQRSLDPDAR